MSLYRPLEAQVGTLRCKLFSSGGVSLSDVRADVRAHGGEGRRRAPVPDHPGRRFERMAVRLRAAVRGRGRRTGPRHLPGRVPRRAAGRARGRRAQRAGTARCADGPRDHRRARGRQVPAPGRNRVLGRVHGAHAARPRRHRGAARQAVRREVRSRCPRRRRGRATEGRDRGGDRLGPEPRRGPDPAQLPVGRQRDAADQLLRRRRSRLAAAVPVVQARPQPDPDPPGAAPEVRDLRVLAAHGGRAPARWQGRPRRVEVVGSPRGLPDRGPGADEGADGQERADRPGRLQGRIRGQAASGRGRSRGAAGGGDRLLPDVPVGDARHHRQHRRRRRRGARAGRPLRRGRPLPGRGRRQGHRHVLGHRQRGVGLVRLLAGRRVRLRRLAGLRPQGDGHHRARRLGVGQAPLPRARHRRAGDRLHGRGDRRHVG